MGTIKNFIEKIKSARYGKDVRQSIVDAIEQTYSDAISNGHTDMEVAKARDTYNDLNSRLEADKNQMGKKIENEEANRKEALENMQKQVNGLASGSPKGTFETKSALETANPETGVYVITEDGHIYSWNKNGNRAIDLGVYQATTVADGTVTPQKTNFIESTVMIGKNKFNRDSADNMFGYVNDSQKNVSYNILPTGLINTRTDLNGRYSVSHFIDIHEYVGRMLYCNKSDGNAQQMFKSAFYNIDKELVAYNSTYLSEIIIPTDAYYFRFNQIFDENTELSISVDDRISYKSYNTTTTYTLKNEIKIPYQNILEIPGTKENVVKFLLPSKLKVIQDVECNIYYQNILRYYNSNLAQLIKTTGKFTNYTKCARLTPNQSTVGGDITIRCYLTNTKIADFTKNINIEVVSRNSGNDLTKKVLIIGDSLTAANVYTQELLNMFENDAMNIELLGTLGLGNGNNHEGRAGWRAREYCFNFYGVYGYSGNNAFFNTDTEQFDFSYYMQQNGYNAVDYVFINLGTNDWIRGDYNTESDIIQYYNLIINSIKKFDQNIKIGIWLPPTRAMMDYEDKTAIDKSLASQEIFIKNYDNRENDNIFLVPVYFNIDPEHDYKYKIEQISARNSDFTQIYCLDNIHPSKSGYNKIADVMYTYIKYFASLD